VWDRIDRDRTCALCEHIRAIDISSKMIAIARAKADASNVSNITFEKSNIDEFSVPDQSFDAVLGLNILHLVDSKEEVIARVYEILKPGGVFVSSTACLGDSMLRLLKLVVPLGRTLNVMPMVRVFTSIELESAITDAGFQIDRHWQQGKGSAVFIVARKTEQNRFAPPNAF